MAITTTTRSHVERTHSITFDDSEAVDMYLAANKLLSQCDMPIRLSIEANVEEQVIAFNKENPVTHVGAFIDDPANAFTHWETLLEHFGFHGEWGMPEPGVLTLTVREAKESTKEH